MEEADHVDNSDVAEKMKSTKRKQKSDPSTQTLETNENLKFIRRKMECENKG